MKYGALRKNLGDKMIGVINLCLYEDALVGRNPWETTDVIIGYWQSEIDSLLDKAFEGFADHAELNKTSLSIIYNKLSEGILNFNFTAFINANKTEDVKRKEIFAIKSMLMGECLEIVNPSYSYVDDFYKAFQKKLEEQGKQESEIKYIQKPEQSNFDRALNNFLDLYQEIERRNKISFGISVNRVSSLRSSLDEFKNRFSQYKEREIEEYFQSIIKEYITNRNFFNADITELNQALTELKTATIAWKTLTMYSEDLQESFDTFLKEINSVTDEKAKPALNKIAIKMEALKKMTNTFLWMNHSVDTIENESKNFFDEAEAIEFMIQEILQNIYPRSVAEKVARAVIKFGGQCLGVVFGVICAVAGMVPGVALGAIQGAVFGFSAALSLVMLMASPNPSSSQLAKQLFLPALIIFPIAGGALFAIYGLVVEGPKSGWKFGNEYLDNCVESFLNGNTPWLKGVKERCEALIQHEKELVDKIVKKIKPR